MTSSAMRSSTPGSVVYNPIVEAIANSVASAPTAIGHCQKARRGVEACEAAVAANAVRIRRSSAGGALPVEQGVLIALTRMREGVSDGM